MTLRISKALRNFGLEAGSIKQALAGGKMKFYTGAQPANADAAPTGTLLVTFTKSGGAHTSEVLASGQLIIAGASGSINTITVNSIDILGGSVSFDTDLATTAAKIAAQINNNPQNLLFVASANSATITIRAKPGLGALANGWVVGYTATTMTATPTNMASGVTAVNGLTFGDSANGSLVKNPLETWQGTAAATGTAGWFRFEAAVADAGGADSSEAIIRLDGAIAVTGGEINGPSTSIVASAVQTLSSFQIDFPANA